MAVAAHGVEMQAFSDLTVAALINQSPKIWSKCAAKWWVPNRHAFRACAAMPPRISPG